MRKLDGLLENRKIDKKKLIAYGFLKENNTFTYKKKIVNELFEVIITIGKEKMAKVIDLAVGEEYILCDINVSGDFVGEVRREYESILQDMVTRCSSPQVFGSRQANEVIRYLEEKYQDELEYLWKSSPNNAIFRNKENKKWYGVFLTISKDKLGLGSDEKIEIIDLRYDREKIEEIIDYKNIYPGYHMNKKSWITILLNNCVSDKMLFELIDNSYKLSLKG